MNQLRCPCDIKQNYVLIVKKNDSMTGKQCASTTITIFPMIFRNHEVLPSSSPIDMDENSLEHFIKHVLGMKENSKL